MFSNVRWSVVAASVVGAGVSLLALPGCVVSGDRDVRVSGQPVANESLMLIEKGETTETQVLDLLGAPSRVVVLGDSRKLFVYEWTRRESSDTAIFLLFAGSSTTEERQVTNIELTDGVVTRWWTKEG